MMEEQDKISWLLWYYAIVFYVKSNPKRSPDYSLYSYIMYCYVLYYIGNETYVRYTTGWVEWRIQILP